MGCHDLMSQIGWHCRDIETLRGERATYVCTPLTLSSGKPLDFFLVENGEELRFTDDGTVMFEMYGMGYPLDDRRNWRGLEGIAEAFGFRLSDDGAFTVSFTRNELWLWGGRILQLFAAVMQWDEDRRADHDQDLTLLKLVEDLLRSKAPDRKLEAPAAVTVRGTDLRFDFRWGNRYVDAVPARAQSTNARLRKAIIARSEIDPTDMLFVVDDRSSIEKADREVLVLGELASAVALRNFAMAA